MQFRTLYRWAGFVAALGLFGACDDDDDQVDSSFEGQAGHAGQAEGAGGEELEYHESCLVEIDYDDLEQALALIEVCFRDACRCSSGDVMTCAQGCLCVSDCCYIDDDGTPILEDDSMECLAFCTVPEQSEGGGDGGVGEGGGEGGGDAG